MYILLWPVPGHSFVFSRWPDLSGQMLPDMYFQVGLMFICLFLDTVLCLQGGVACSWTQFCVFEVAWPVWVDANVPGMYFEVGLMCICLFLDTVLCF